MSFESLGLMPELLRAVRDKGYETPTSIQSQAIPTILQGRDVLGGSQTGTGKTAAFTLPLLQKLASAAQGPGRRPVLRALVLTPTRELALQVEESIQAYGKHLSLKSTTIFGGVNVNPQIRTLKAGVDIVVATPGRLLDHHEQGTIDFKQVEFLILDEADRMLDMGFIRDIKKILALLPKQRQNLLFSATYNDDIRVLAEGLLKDPVSIDVAPRNSGTHLVTHVVHPVDRERKKELLLHLAKKLNLTQALVFTRTKHMANNVADALNEAGITAMAIHGNKSQPRRIEALSGFKSGKLRILVATDIAARGLDIVDLPHVVNFELPYVAEDFVHRTGRTGRNGSEGDAIALVCVDEDHLLRDIEKLMKRSLPKEVVPGFAPDTSIKAEPLMKTRRSGGGQGGGRNQGRNQQPARQAQAPREERQPREERPSAPRQDRQPREDRTSAPRQDRQPREDRAPAPRQDRPDQRSGGGRSDRGPRRDEGAAQKSAQAPRTERPRERDDNRGGRGRSDREREEAKPGKPVDDRLGHAVVSPSAVKSIQDVIREAIGGKPRR